MHNLNKYKQKVATILTVALIGIFINACSTSSTAVTGSWTNETAPSAKYRHIIVTPLIANKSITTNMENELAESLSAYGIKAEKGSNLLPQKYIDSTVDKNAIFQSLEVRKIDAILTVSIVDQESETRYVMGNRPYSPSSVYSYYGTYWGYYDYMYRNVYRQGYYVTDHYYYIEANLFDSKTEKLLWSAQTKTHDPATIEKITNDLSEKITEQMKIDGII
jgi:hypothetical protein